MTALSQRLAVGPAYGAGARRLAVTLAPLHAAMFVYDLAHPDRFLNADRADQRIEVIKGFARALQTGDGFAYTTRHGIVGDWLPQALLYAAGGQYLVIAVQIALALASVLWVREIGLRLGLRESPAQSAALLYALLPHTLVFPHQLASESIFVPLVILSFRLPSGSAAGLAIGVATLVRPITALWPLVHVFAKRERRAYLVLAFAPLALWMSAVFVATGEFSMGRSHHDLGTNLYQRLQRMAGDLPPAARPPERPGSESKATLGEYFAFALSHPLVTVKYAARDMAIAGFKSGIERVVLDYLYVYPERRNEIAESGWRSRVDRGGAAAFRDLVRREPVGLIGAAALGAVAFTVLMLFAVYGAVRWARGAERLALVGFVIYIIVTVQAVDVAQSRQRAPAEFAICLVAVAGWLACRRRGRDGG